MKTALVTGAGRGIGRAVAEELARRGWRVVASARDPEIARFESDAIKVVRLDVTDPASVRAGVAEAEAIAGGALDAVISNAGYALLGAMEDVDLTEVRAVFDTNTFGALAVVQAALPAMRSAGAGAIVFVSTIGARLQTPFLGAYRASKAALNAFAEVLSAESRPFGIRVSRVEPGMVATEFGASTRRSGSVTDPNGPYGRLAEQFRPALGRWRERDNIGADRVAAVIADLVEDPQPPPVVLVGDDARRLAECDEDGLLDFLGLEWPKRSSA